MTGDQVGAKVMYILVTTLAVPYEDIKWFTRIREDLDVDSLDIIEIVMNLEDAFDLEINDELIYKWITVKDIIDYITSEVS